MQNCTSMICYKKKMRPTVFQTFLNLVGVWEDFPKSKILTLVTMVYSWYVYEYCFMGPSGRFYSCYL